MTDEQAEVLGWFTEMLRSVTADGGRKRASGLKPSWKIDGAHEAAIFSHLNKWKHGEKVDKDSGVHPLVHMAWRALAIAWQETRAFEREKAATISNEQDEIADALRAISEAGRGSSFPGDRRLD